MTPCRCNPSPTTHVGGVGVEERGESSLLSKICSRSVINNCVVSIRGKGFSNTL